MNIFYKKIGWFTIEEWTFIVAMVATFVGTSYELSKGNGSIATLIGLVFMFIWSLIHYPYPPKES